MPTTPISPNADLLGNIGTAVHTNVTPTVPGVDDTVRFEPSRWYTAEINELQCNQSYPSQLDMMQKVGDGFQTIDSAVFTLPIPPESLSRDMPFAIKLAATVGGIVEQHNAIPIRPISISGTTGLLPLRGTGQPLPARSFAQAIYGGTLIASQISGVLGQASQISVAPANLANSSTIPVNSTGYYQFLMLQKFLEIYATLKKSKQGRNIFLAFAIYKEQAYYLVTPRHFSLQRSVAAPMMFNYSFQMEAFGRVNPTNGGGVSVPNTSIYSDPSGMNSLLNKMVAAQADLYQYLGTIQGFNGEVQAILLEPIRQTILFVKNALGTVLTAADLPINIQLDH